MRGHWIDTIDDLRALSEPWGDIADQCARPYSGPGWAMSWWDHDSDSRCSIRAIAVYDGSEMVGMAPFYAYERFGLTEYRLLGSLAAPRIEPLAVPGTEAAVAKVMASMLSAASPAVTSLRFDGIPADSTWPARLTAPWADQGTVLTHRRPTVAAPTIDLRKAHDFDEWMATRSRRFRNKLRRARRQLEGLGARFSVAETPSEIDMGLKALVRLCRARHPRQRTLFSAERVAMLRDVATYGAGSKSHVRLAMATIGSRTVSAHLLLCAGGEIAHWAGGFDEQYSFYSPSVVTLLDVIAREIGAGEQRIDLGQGTHPYKLRLADDQDVLQWSTVVPPSKYQRRAVAVLAPDRTRLWIGHRLDEDRKVQLRAFAQRTASVQVPSFLRS